MRRYTIAVLPGDGIGPEVTHEAIRVLRAAASAFDFVLSFEERAMGGCALDLYDTPFPVETQQTCEQSDAVLLGAIGGPKWDQEKGARRCESGLLALRKCLGAYANLRPVVVDACLTDRSPLRPERVRNTDVLIVRELTGGIYFGEPRREGLNTMRYTPHEVERIARVAFMWARKRSGQVTSVDKANVLEVSQLWRRVVTDVHREEFSDVRLEHLYVDNAAMQLVLRPQQFDVILTGNIFGDILSDLSATLPGSLGVLPSASIGGSVGLFEPVHGTAPDIAGRGIANPIGTILSGSMMLRTLGEDAAASAIQHGVATAFREGIRTADLGGSASTQDMGQFIARNIVPAMATASV